MVTTAFNPHNARLPALSRYRLFCIQDCYFY